MKCLVIECQNKISARGLCRKHYSRMMRNTNPEYRKRMCENSKRWVKNNREKWNKKQREYNKTEGAKQSRLRYDINHPDLFYLRLYHSRCGGRCPDPINVRKTNYERMMRVFVRSYK